MSRSRTYPTSRLVLWACFPGALSIIAALWPGAAFALAGWVGLLWLALWDRAPLAGRKPLRLHCELPKKARVKVPCTLSYRVEGPLTESRLWLLDELPSDLGGDCYQRVREPRLLPSDNGDTALELEIERTPSRRGLRPLGPWFVLEGSRLGLWRRRERAEGERQVGVLPAGVLAATGALGVRRALQELGIKPRRPRGEGTDFESLRDYTPDDEPRKIDWRASARRLSPVVRDYHVERNNSVVVAVDCGRLMATHIDGQSKLDHALSAALLLVQASSGSGDRVAFTAFDRELRAWVPPQPPRRSFGPIATATLPLEPRPEEASYALLAQVLRQRQRKRCLLVVLTDFVEGGGSEELQSHLMTLARKHCVLLVGLRDRWLQRLDEPAPQLDAEELYRRLVLRELDISREVTLGRMSRGGVHTLDVDPSAISAPLLSRYLAIREAGLV